MSEKKKSRNEQIAELLRNGEKLKNFYRFTAQNPHIELHDACQIVLAHPKASICFYIEEWNELGRRVTQGRKGSMFYDANGNKQYVYDLHDTHGDRRYRRLTYPMRRLLYGLDELNGTELAVNNRKDYSKVLSGVAKYLDENGYFTEDERRNSLIAEGVAYSLYSKTGFPKDADVSISGLPYSVNENARLFKEMYELTETVKEEIEAVYELRMNRPLVLDDIEEETVSDEPVVTENMLAEQENVSELDRDLPPLYKKYKELETGKPEAFVLCRVGDFYEVIGEKAQEAANILGIMLTSRDFGIAEHVPMCGFSVHAADEYIAKLAQNNNVLVAEESGEPIYISALTEESGKTANDEELSELAEIYASEFEENAEEAEFSEIDNAEEAEESDEESEEYADESDETEAPEAEKTSRGSKQPKGGEKSIRERKKETPQASLFDYFEPQKKSREEQLIERQLLRGSGFENGKYRIYDKYYTEPTLKEYASFLKHEYGIGGYSYGHDLQDHNGKGIRMEWYDRDHPENNIRIDLKWNEAAIRIADLIDEDRYLTEEEKAYYEKRYKPEQAEQRKQREAEQKKKDEFVYLVIQNTGTVRKQRILDEYGKIAKIIEFAEFLSEEYGYSTEATSRYLARYDANGVRLSKYDRSGNTEQHVNLSWNDFAEKVCELIESDRLFPEERDNSDEEKPEFAETEQTLKKPIKPFNRFTELSSEDKAYYDEYIRKPNREPRDSPWDTVQDCTVIAPGIYSVITAGHGGIMIDKALAPHILSQEALSEGFVENGYYCYEEDAAESIPLRELYDKGILDKTNEYFTRLEYISPDLDAEAEYIGFSALPEAEQERKLKHWNDAVNETIAHWYPNYWEVYEQSCRTETEWKVRRTEWKVRRFVDLMVEEGIRETHNGNFSFTYNHYTEEAEQFVREYRNEIAEELTLRKEVQSAGLLDDGFEVKFRREYCSCLDEISISESKGGEQGENTDLNAVLDQSELGGAKSRFKGNIDAIRLMNRLYLENREATGEERKVLARYVGWGGLAQAFDETNRQWQKEYAELKDILTTEQYEKARGSVLNAHYTSKEVIGGIYAALKYRETH